jgi:hypothetical protein
MAKASPANAVSGPVTIHRTWSNITAARATSSTTTSGRRPDNGGSTTPNPNMNRVHIEPTIFTNPRFKPGTEGQQTFGWRAWDDLGQCYDNTWHDGIPDDDMEFLKKVLQSDDVLLWAMIEYCDEEKKGVHIGDHYYTWDTIEGIIKAKLEREKAAKYGD